MYTSSSYLDFETALSWPAYKKTKDSIQRVCSCGKIQFWIVECKREVKHAQFFGKIKKKDYIHTTVIHQIKLIISKSGFKDLFIMNNLLFHSMI